ncbi:hypothetical protein QQX13_12135 [Demequina sp. SYSU T00068]|uniref:hypothetical protein n=1 Tax=Demequina lignilytica TaxID=3051663 RepID=UPI00261693A1|nr:hypothetical protein [Demequina sp. SYSU T00068]MDN4491583.1 hypothetical protein [Demequina sp. SYSU T00068]
MTEMLAALLGALVGGGLSAWVGARQTAKVLSHETDLAATERKEAQRADEDRRRAFAADHLIAALADFTSALPSDADRTPYFVRVSATADVHQNREIRASALLQAGSSHVHALPEDLQERWDALVWMVRFGQLRQPDRAEELRRRDASDLLNYVEYVRRSLRAVAGDEPMPARFPVPEVRRDGPRPWGFRPESGQDEPDLTDWQLADRLVGEVRFTSGEVRWFGPNGLVEDLPRDSSGAAPAGA